MLDAVYLRKRATPRLSNSFDVGVSQANCTFRGVSLGRLRAITAADIRKVECYSSFHVVYLHRDEPPVHTNLTHKSVHQLNPWFLPRSPLASGRYHQSLGFVFVLSLTVATIQRMPSYEKTLHAEVRTKGSTAQFTLALSVFVTA